MLFLSDLLHYQIEDVNGHCSKLLDLTFDPLDGDDYPTVRHLVVRGQNHQRQLLDWKCVQSWQPERALVALCHRDPLESLGIKEVLLGEDVLDATILDLKNRRATRANDVVLNLEQNRLRVCAVDIGAGAVLRRLTRGRLRLVREDNLFDWRYVEFLRGDLQAAAQGEAYTGRVGRLPAGDIAALCEKIPYLHAAELIYLLPDELAAETLQILPPEMQLQVFEEMPPDKALALLNQMAPDLAADLLALLELDQSQHWLNLMKGRSRDRVLKLLEYPADSAGGIMTNDLLSYPIDWTVGQAREQLRTIDSRYPHYIYLVEGQAPRLVGTVTLKKFMAASDQQTLESLVNRFVAVVPVDQKASPSAYQVLRSHLLAMPVVGAEGEFLGAITAEAALAQILPDPGSRGSS